MIVQTQTTSFKVELYQAVHNFTTDDIKIALYTSSVTLDEDTTAYSTENEISGTGYVAGGKSMTGITIDSSGSTAFISFDNVLWNPAAFTTRCALIYNASKSNKSIAVLDFGSDKTCTNSFQITMPAATASAALIRSSN